jgi:hypothetical protein
VPPAPANREAPTLHAPASIINQPTINRLRLAAADDAAEEDTWVRVVAVRGDIHETVFEGLIPPGASVPGRRTDSWRGDSFIVTARQAAAIKINLNGKDHGSYKKPGLQRFQVPATE